MKRKPIGGHSTLTIARTDNGLRVRVMLPGTDGYFWVQEKHVDSLGKLLKGQREHTELIDGWTGEQLRKFLQGVCEPADLLSTH